MIRKKRARLGGAIGLACLAATLHAPVPSVAATANDRPVAGFPSFDGDVHAIARTGSTVYLGGAFSQVTDSSGNRFTRHGAAAVDAATGRVLAWNPDVRGRVLDLARRGKSVYLVGDFTSVRGERRTDAARVAASTGRVLRFAPRLTGQRGVPSAVHAIAVTRTRIFLGGSFTDVGRTSRRKLAAFSTQRPFRLLRWRPAAEGGAVRDVAATRAGLYVAGSFTNVNGKRATRRLALVTRSTGRVRTSFDSRVRRPVLSIDLRRRALYAGQSGSGGAVGRYDARSGAQRWLKRMDGDAQAVKVWGGTLHVGGHFDNYCGRDANLPGGGACDGVGTPRRKALSLQTSNGGLTGWTPQFDGARGTWVIRTDPARDHLLVGGNFDTANNGATRARRFAVFSTS